MLEVTLERAAHEVARVFSNIVLGPEDVFAHLTLTEGFALADLFAAIGHHGLAADVLIAIVLDDSDFLLSVGANWAEIQEVIERADKHDIEWSEGHTADRWRAMLRDHEAELNHLIAKGTS